jgi:hypothetical protein
MEAPDMAQRAALKTTARSNANPSEKTLEW